jgi:hypothetical protein
MAWTESQRRKARRGRNHRDTETQRRKRQRVQEGKDRRTDKDFL